MSRRSNRRDSGATLPDTVLPRKTCRLATLVALLAVLTGAGEAASQNYSLSVSPAQIAEGGSAPLQVTVQGCTLSLIHI